MRLGLKLLKADSTVNNVEETEVVTIARGETLDFLFQLVDLDSDGYRYIPASGSTVMFSIPRADQVFADQNNTRRTENNGLSRAAVQAFTGDSSIWKTPMTEAETLKMVSGSIRVVVTEGSSKKIAAFTGAIKVIDGQDQ